MGALAGNEQSPMAERQVMPFAGSAGRTPICPTGLLPKSNTRRACSPSPTIFEKYWRLVAAENIESTPTSLLMLSGLLIGPCLSVSDGAMRYAIKAPQTRSVTVGQIQERWNSQDLCRGFLRCFLTKPNLPEVKISWRSVSSSKQLW